MTEEQRAKAGRLRDEAGLANVTYVKGYIEEIPLGDARFDAVISNGVINLSADKPAVFREASRVLKRGGRLALSDIVTDSPLPDGIVCNATLWAACIGGAMQQDDYRTLIEKAGFVVERVQENPAYRFLSSNAQGAARKYGVKSVSLVAFKPS
jgi:ubiquinone/menaquinone biosynthesis C-methylase UbiE